MVALLFAPAFSQAQLVVNESFDAVTFPPYGWATQKIVPSSDINNIVIRRTASVTPAASPATPRTGAGMASYECALMTVAGEKAFLASRKLDMRAMPGGGATGSFWMWRENNSAFADSISLYVNDSSSIFYSGGNPVSCNAVSLQQVAPFGFSTTFSRYATQPPAGTAGTWHQYNFTIPFVATVTNIPNLSVVIVFTNRHNAAGPSNIYIDDFQVQSWPQQQVFVSTTSSFQNSAVIPQGSTDNLIYGVNIVVTGGDTTVGNTFRVDSLAFNTNGSTNAGGDCQNAKLWWTGGTNSWTGTANATQIGATVASLAGTNYTFYPANSFRLHSGTNYFWITYDVKATGISTPGNCIDAEYIGCGLGGGGSTTGFKSPAAFNLPGCRPIDVAYCGGATPSYSVGTSWLGGSYTNNDYVQSVLLVGEPGYGQINNNLNSNGPPGFFGPGPTACPNCQFSAHGPDYERFAPNTNYTTAVLIGQVYSITLKVGTWTGSNYIAAWIDFNHDGVFNNALLPAGEKLAQSGPLLANGTYTVSFTVPLGAYIGNTTLRVREVYATSNIDPCASYTFGEAEDYQITIIPPCTVYPGYTKVWLGTFDDDWNNALNWCPAGVPIITSNTIIPGSSPNRPVIKNGVTALTNKLKIQGNDSLYVNAYGTGSLTINDSLNIVGASACMRVISQFNDTALVSTGTLNGTFAPNHITFAAAARQRTQLIFTQAELLAQGMLAGDVIDSIYLLIKSVSGSGAGLTYNNFTVSYYYTNPGFSFSTPAYLAPVVIPGGTIYTNPSLTISSAQQLKLLLSSPITWSGVANPIVINICYDKVTTGSPSHIMGYTQTLGFRRYMQIYSTTANPLWPACSFAPSQRAALPSLATTGNTVITIGAFNTGSSASLVQPGMLVSSTPTNSFAAGTTVVSLVGTTLTLSTGNTVTIGSGQTILFSIPGLTSSDVNCVADRRPNLTFHFKRNYQVYPISVAGHWNNSGTWIAGKSTVTLNGSLSPQKIEGTSFSTFKNLRLNKGAAAQTVSVWKDVTITDSLNLTMGRLQLNGNPVAPRLVKLMSGTGLQGALIYTASGSILSESNPPNYGSFRWNVGKPATYPQTYVVPLINSSGIAIPFDYKLNADSGDVQIATYSTIPANTPIPTGVSDIYQNTWIAPPMTDNSPNMVDRFWQVDETGSATNRDFTFRWASGENAASGTGPYRAQVYDPSLNWGWPFIIGQSNPTATSVTIPAVGYTNTWSVVKQDQPLPVELLSFRAKAHKDKEVICDWSTASEINNDYFTVERSLDGKTFEYAGKVKGSGTINEARNYTFTDNSPYRGVSYYRLRQTDFNGRTEAFNVVAVDLSVPSTAVEVYPVPASNEVVFRVDNVVGLEGATLYVYDLTGRKIITQKVSELKGTETNLFVLPLSGVQNGVYHFELRTEQQLIGNGKFICKK